jgi:hypothetical protein
MPAATVAAPPKTAKRGKSAGPSAVERLLASGQTSKIDPVTGRSQALHAKCPTDGAPSGVRRVTRGGAGIMEVTLRCPRCAVDFVAATSSLYLS